MAGSKWTCFGVRMSKTLDYPTTNLNLSMLTLSVDKHDYTLISVKLRVTFR